MEQLELTLAYDLPEKLVPLFTEYTDMLVQEDPSFRHYLDIQHYDDEVRDLRKKYGLPDGRLYLAHQGDTVIGCVGLRRLNDSDCELKRLYIRPAYRGRGYAHQLLDQILSDARSIGYRRMLLDTLPSLETAIGMYRRMGFYDIPCYNDSPLEDTVFLQLDL